VLCATAAVQGLGVATALERVRRKLAGSKRRPDRQMVKILAAVLSDGLPAWKPPALSAVRGRPFGRRLINILARQRDPAPAATILTPDALRLRHAPVADCARYDQLRSAEL